jgi:hypothetical protein
MYLALLWCELACTVVPHFATSTSSMSSVVLHFVTPDAASTSRFQWRLVVEQMQPQDVAAYMCTRLEYRKNTKSVANLPTPMFWHQVLHQ